MLKIAYATHSKKFVILACTVFIQIKSVTNEQTDGRMNGQTPGQWLRHAKHYMLSRVTKITEIQ